MISNSSTGPGLLYLELNAPRSRVSVDVRYFISYVFLIFVIFLIFILVVLLPVSFFINFSTLPEYCLCLPLFDFPLLLHEEYKKFYLGA